MNFTLTAQKPKAHCPFINPTDQEVPNPLQRRENKKFRAAKRHGQTFPAEYPSALLKWSGIRSGDFARSSASVRKAELSFYVEAEIPG